MKKEFFMGFVQEFKEFALKGNVVDLAVGVVIGGAFGKIVTALVDSIIMPLVGLLTGGVDFSTLSFKLANPVTIPGMKEVAPAAIKYGQFIQVAFDFIIVALVLFMVIKAMNSLKKAQPAPVVAPPALSVSEKLLQEILDTLKTKA
jgi:large conductance mechanosensitive channel